MTVNFFLKLLAAIAIGIVLVFLVSGLYLGREFYNSIFRLSSNQVASSLRDVKPQCKKLIDCSLLPGDILIRRYITKRVWMIDKLTQPYFTHSAFYLGGDQLAEAVGTEKNPEDEIQISILSKNDWFNFDVDNFVVIRPKNYSTELDSIIGNLKQIAEDADYTFGLPKPGYKKTTCADLIFHQLWEANIIRDPNPPKIITPDYLFWLAKNDPSNFEIIGYNIPE